MSYDIASISETTTPINKKFQDNIWTTKMCPAMQYCDVITNPRWRTAAILTVTWPKIEIFKVQAGGGRHLENRFFGHNSSTDCPISVKFCIRKQHGMSTRATWQKLQMTMFKIQDGGRPPFWKSLNCHISVKNRPILMKFGTLQQMVNQIAVSWPKIEMFKIQDGVGRHLENRFFGHNSSTDCLISAKFCMRKQNGILTKATWQKLQIFKIQDGGRPPFWKS